MSHIQRSPRFTVEDAIDVAAKWYGLPVTARPLPSERDQNFHLTTTAGEAYVLKIAGADDARDVLDLQNRALAHLHAADSRFAPLQLQQTLMGESMFHIPAADGTKHHVRLLRYVPGKPLADVKPHTPALLRSLGAYLGVMDRALAAFTHPAADRTLQWDLRQAPAVIRRHLGEIADPTRRAWVSAWLDEFEGETAPRLSNLRTSIIHNDGNDYNVIVAPATLQGPAEPTIAGVIDFGDMVHSYTVAEPAIAAAYAMLHKADPLTAAAHLIAGYHAEYPLTEDELALLYPLIRMRLCASVCLAAHQQRQQPENRYLSISEQPAWALIERLRNAPPNLAHYTFRQACGLPPCTATPAIVTWLEQNAGAFHSVVTPDLRSTALCPVDLSVGSPLLAERPTWGATELNARLVAEMADAGAAVGVGRYNEARLLYTSRQFDAVTEELPERRTIHLGVDLFLPPGSPVFAPLAGVVYAVANNEAHQDYGPVILLEHTADDQPAGAPAIHFFTLYGHLSRESLAGLYPGKRVAPGEQIGAIGDSPSNGDWPPHLHFQIISDLLGMDADFPGVAAPSQRALWLSLSPDPNLILQMPAAVLSPPGRNTDELLAARRQRIGRSLSISYRKPLKIVRGQRQFLYDDEGRAYLDVVNNVCHIGHCHPHVVRAGQAQMAVLNTNTRYLHDNLVEYAERLTATLPAPLSVCFFVNSGSEANDLALRLARVYTGQTDTVCLDVAYHGNLSSLIDISPYKHDGPGGRGAPPTTHVSLMPDPYRGPYRGMETGAAYARHVAEQVAQVEAQGRGVAAFIAESLLGCGGQIVLPDGYLAEAYRHVRAAGGVCIADEVQVGFGRVGTHFWGFETQGVIPDIVTLGKPIGNGHPLGAVVTTPAIADAFANGMEYFNTFGGNPVSCAIGIAVLEVIEREGLQAHALRTGNRLMEGLRELMARHRLIGDVRGLGLFIGAELVVDRESRAPAGEAAAYVADRMRGHGILISTDGPDHNVLKLKPPLPFDAADADRLVATLDRVLAEDAVR